MRFSHWLRPLAARSSRVSAPRTRRRETLRPCLEVLEDRITPTGPILTTLASFNGTTNGYFPYAITLLPSALLIALRNSPVW